MEVIEKKIGGNKEIELCFIGDTHIGAKAFAEENFLNARDYVKEKPNRYMVGMGDFVDTIAFTDKRFSIDEVDERMMYINEQFDYLYELLKPIREKIIGLHIGNHETKFAMRQSYNGLIQVCKRLNTNFLDDTAIIKIKMGKKERVIHSTHGFGGGWSLGAVVNRILKEPQIIRNASIHSFAHSHKLFAVLYPLGLQIKNGSLIPSYAWFLNTGSFLKGFLIGTSTYAERKHYPLNPLGFAVAKLFKDEVDCGIRIMDKERRWGDE